MQRPAILVHGGAGRYAPEIDALAEAGCGQAAAAGWAVLSRGGSALDAVVAAVTAMEDAPVFNAGVGSCLTEDGRVEMDASVMDGEPPIGAGVGVVTTVRNPVQLARALLRDGRHVLLAGAGAEAFARLCGVATASPDSFITARQRQRWQQRIAGDGGTVGAVAVDADGHTAAATSTGGLLGKLPGRIGDSAILGAGTYADDRAGAASATGQGEAIIIAGLAKAAVDGLRAGRHPATVAATVVRELYERGGASVGIIVVDRFGRLGAAHSAERMPIGACPSVIAGHAVRGSGLRGQGASGSNFD
jgi:L-asparaginase / beta-aspartyl-peptidase